MNPRPPAELTHRIAKPGLDERVNHDCRPATRLLHCDVQVFGVLDPRMANLLERLVGELRLEREHEPLCGLPRRVRHDVELDGLTLELVGHGPFTR